MFDAAQSQNGSQATKPSKMIGDLSGLCVGFAYNLCLFAAEADLRTTHLNCGHGSQTVNSK